MFGAEFLDICKLMLLFGTHLSFSDAQPSVLPSIFSSCNLSFFSLVFLSSCFLSGRPANQEESEPAFMNSCLLLYGSTLQATVAFPPAFSVVFILAHKQQTPTPIWGHIWGSWCKRTEKLGRENVESPELWCHGLEHVCWIVTSHRPWAWDGNGHSGYPEATCRLILNSGCLHLLISTWMYPQVMLCTRISLSLTPSEEWTPDFLEFRITRFPS